MYADSTWLDTSIIADQGFSNTWQILYTNTSLSHSAVTANGVMHKSQIIWGIPGQTYDRYVGRTSAVLSSFLPPDEQNESVTNAIPDLILNGKNYVMREVPSIGTQTFWGAAYGDGVGGPLIVGAFAKSGQSSATFRLSGMTCDKGHNLYWTCGAWMFANTSLFYGVINMGIN